MRARTMGLSVGLMSVLSIGCGSSSSDTGPSPSGSTGPTGATGPTGSSTCSMTVTGDAASGVGTFTLPCGFPIDVANGLETVGPAVEKTYSVGLPVDQASILVIGQFPAGVLKGTGFNAIGSGTLPVGTLTEATAQAAQVELLINYAEVPQATTSKAWLAYNDLSGQRGGSFTLTVSSAVPTALTACDSIFSPFAAHACLQVHGTLHAVLVPATNVTPPNVAAGTVTLDVAF